MSSGCPVACKILTEDQYRSLLENAVFAGSDDDRRDGYLHLSTESQVAATVAKHFSEQRDLYLAVVDLTLLGDAVKWEPSRGGALFPHLHGPLPMSAVLEHGRLDDIGREIFL